MKFANTTPNKHDRQRLGPCISFNEAMSEFGMSKGALMQAISSDPSAPRPRVRHKNATYYDAKAMRAWWAARKKT